METRGELQRINGVAEQRELKLETSELRRQIQDLKTEVIRGNASVQPQPDRGTLPESRGAIMKRRGAF